MMKRLLLLAALVFTGASSAAADDRINLWPLLYKEPGKLSILWPIYEKKPDGFAVRPLFGIWQNGREYDVLWPLGNFDGVAGEYRFFPFFWSKGHFTAFPLIYHAKNDFTFVLPFMGTGGGSKRRFITILPPLYFRREGPAGRTDVLWPIFNVKTGSEEKGWRVAPLFGSYRNDSGDRRFALYPIYHHSQSQGRRLDWLFPLYARGSNGDSQWTVLPGVFLRSGARGEGLFLTPLYGHGETSDGGWRNVLGPIYLHRWSKDGRSRTYDLMWPVFQRARGDSLDAFRFWPLFGHRRKGDASHIFAVWPLYWQGERRDLSTSYRVIFPIYWDYISKTKRVRSGGSGERSRWTGVLPLFTRTQSDDRVSYAFLWPLFWTGDAEGEGRKFEFLWRIFDYESSPRVTQARVLWRLFRYRRDGETMDLDTLPFISVHRDPKRREYSFLWRFFRYENDSGRRRLYLLFAPIM